MFERLQRMTRSQIAGQIEAFQKQHSADETRRVAVSKGQKFVVLRADNEAFALSIGEMTQNPDGSNQQLIVTAVPIGKLPVEERLLPYWFAFDDSPSPDLQMALRYDSELNGGDRTLAVNSLPRNITSLT